MYCPFVRGRSYDLLAIKDCIDSIDEHNGILPIIEPFNFSAVVNTCKKLKKNGKPFILIVNPLVGKTQEDIIEIKKNIYTNLIDKFLLEYNNYYIAYQITTNTKRTEIIDFIMKNKERKIVFIHLNVYNDLNFLTTTLNSAENLFYNVFLEQKVSEDYKDNFMSKKILVTDCFHRTRNADYPENEFFSDLPITYSKKGYDGFGDFLIETLAYSKGFAPYAVTIHLTFVESNKIWIKRFISTSNTTNKDIAGKFLEAVEKLGEFIKTNPLFFSPYSTAIEEYIKLYKAGHFPQLGTLKRLSMRHHLQLIKFYYL